MSETLYLVATPIGNLSDISHRALETLRKVEIIACEDTRHTRKLLNHYGISKKLISCHEHNENERAGEICNYLRQNRAVALVSDAGTPGICDPALKVVRQAIAESINVVAIPGAVAFVNALIVSGLATDSFFFGGFLPAKKNDRRKRLEEVSLIPTTLIFYEAPHRLEKSLADCLDVLGNREAVVIRELTKIHEEIIRGNLQALAEISKNRQFKGEIVLVIDRQTFNVVKETSENQKSLLERVNELEKEGLNHKQSLKKAAKELGLKRDEAYRILLAEKLS